MNRIIKLNEKSGAVGTVTIRQYIAGTLDIAMPYVRQAKIYSQLEHNEPDHAMRAYYSKRRRDMKAVMDHILSKGEKADPIVQRNIIVSSFNYGKDILVQFLLSAYNGGFSINNATVLTGTTDGTTATITGFSSTAGLAPGMMITGADIPPYSTIITINSGTSITISQATTVAGTVPLYFFQVQQLGVSWGEIGTGATTPTAADTALTTPVARMPVSYAVDNAFNEAQIQFFFPDALLPNQTYYEFGTFVGGNQSFGSGNMFNHALFSVSYPKSAGTDSTIECDFSF